MDVLVRNLGEKMAEISLRVERLMKRGQVSRALQALVEAALSPKTEETLEELRRKRPQAALRQIPQEVMDYAPDSPLAMDMKIFAKCLRIVSRTWEMFERDVEVNVSQCFMLANLTAFQKKDRGVRGIVTGTTFRRLLAKTLARQVSPHGRSSMRPISVCTRLRGPRGQSNHRCRL